MSLSDSLKHPWLRSYTPTYNLKAYDTVSSLDPHDFSMLSSMPGFNMNASVTTNLNGLQITSNRNIPGPAAVAEGKGFT
jgi:serine/threonine/tyrosine protein kinase RAD53